MVEGVRRAPLPRTPLGILTGHGLQFDTKTKLLFDSEEDNYLIKFGFDRDNDKDSGVSRGRLTLSGYAFRCST